MTLPAKSPLPQASLTWFNTQGRQDFAQYMLKIDALITAMAGGNVGTLTNAANDAAAATAGVAIGQLYRNGSVVQVRET